MNAPAWRAGMAGERGWPASGDGRRLKPRLKACRHKTDLRRLEIPIQVSFRCSMRRSCARSAAEPYGDVLAGGDVLHWLCDASHE